MGDQSIDELLEVALNVLWLTAEGHCEVLQVLAQRLLELGKFNWSAFCFSGKGLAGLVLFWVLGLRLEQIRQRLQGI